MRRCKIYIPEVRTCVGEEDAAVVRGLSALFAGLGRKERFA